MGRVLISGILLCNTVPQLRENARTESHTTFVPCSWHVSAIEPILTSTYSETV